MNALPDYLYQDKNGQLRQKMDWVEADEHPEASGVNDEGWFQGLLALVFGN